VTLLDEAGFGAAVRDFEHTAFRLELQQEYREPCEEQIFASFLAGVPVPGPDVPELAAWFSHVAASAAQGKRIERVRVQQDPPTPYQQFERWLDQWNIAAGETMRYLTRQRAQEIGLPYLPGGVDWWLLDSSRLVVMRFDDEGHRVSSELVADPAKVVQACTWRDLAVHHATEARLSDVAA
jgi:hypothetical protein